MLMDKLSEVTSGVPSYRPTIYNHELPPYASDVGPSYSRSFPSRHGYLVLYEYVHHRIYVSNTI